MLVHHSDSALLRVQRAVQLDPFTGDPQEALVGPVDAADGLDQGALTGAVLTDQCEYLAGEQLERHILGRNG